MDAVDREFEALGVADVIIGALAGNADALRLYERRGFRPTWLYLSRFADGALPLAAGRVEDAQPDRKSVV